MTTFWLTMPLLKGGPLHVDVGFMHQVNLAGSFESRPRFINTVWLQVLSVLSTTTHVHYTFIHRKMSTGLFLKCIICHSSYPDFMFLFYFLNQIMLPLITLQYYTMSRNCQAGELCRWWCRSIFSYFIDSIGLFDRSTLTRKHLENSTIIRI